MNQRWRRGVENMVILGHRGTRQRGTENTIESFDAALLEGADGVELDVRLSADGKVVVFHDPELSRMTLGRDQRAVHDVSSSELLRLPLAGGGSIPLLDDVLQWSRDHLAHLNIELKANTSSPATLVVRVIEMLARIPAGGPLLCSSFDPRLVSKMRQLDPALGVGLLMEEASFSDSREGAWQKLGASAICCEASLATAERTARWQTQNVLLVAWTVNERARIRHLRELGFDAVISDFPTIAVEALRSTGGQHAD